MQEVSLALDYFPFLSLIRLQITVFVSVLSIIGEITRLEDRPKLFGYATDYLDGPFCLTFIH